MSAQLLADLEDLYRAAVGPRRTDYYASKFLRFDEPGISRISWNWPAFFVSFYWFLYRRMYGPWAVFCLLIPFAIGLCGGTVVAALRLKHPLFIVYIATSAYSYLILPMFANALYHSHIKRRIEILTWRVSQPSAQITVLENTPHTSPIACVLPAIAAIPLIGIMTAIAIPAYQMYTVRTQVARGLMLAKPLENAVAEHYRQEHRWPVDLVDLGISQPPSDQYVSTIGLDHGTVSITYGNRANRLIAGHALSLRPTILAGRIVWACGYADIGGADPATGAPGPSRTDIDAKDLPSACHGREHPPSAAIASPAQAPDASAVHAEAARATLAVGAIPDIPLDVPDSMAVTQQVWRMRMQAIQQQIRSGGRPIPPILDRCFATVPIDDAGVPAADFAITCSDPRVADILRRAISIAGTPHARPGTTVLLRVVAPFPSS